MNVWSCCRHIFIKKRDGRRSRRGAILFVAVGAVTALSILALGATSSVMQELRLARYVTDDSADFLVAYSAVEILVYAMRGDDTPGVITFKDLKERTFTLGDRTLMVSGVDEARFVDIGTASVDVLSRLPGVAGQTGLAESMETAQLRFKEDIPLLPDMTPEIYETIRPFVTLSNQLGVNINTAGPEVLGALGMDADLVDKIRIFRAGFDGQEGTGDDAVFLNAGEIPKSLEPYNLTLNQQEWLATLVTSGRLTVKSDNIVMTIIVKRGRSSQKFQALVHLPTVTIITWIEG